jgi:HD-like signal output (HDOD) protein
MRAKEEIQRAIKAVRPLPEVAQRVLVLIRDPEYRIDELVGLVRTDPSLVGRVLRLCNSARSGLAKEITSIGDAIAYLGTRNLVQLVLATCSAGMFETTKRSAYADPAGLWQHSVACAVTCQLLAADRVELAPATAFTLGILHDIGKVALSQIADEPRVARGLAACADQPECELVTLERAIFDTDHAEVAGLVAQTWRLPESLVAPLANHHDPTALAGADPLPALLHIADELAMQCGIGKSRPNDSPS